MHRFAYRFPALDKLQTDVVFAFAEYHGIGLQQMSDRGFIQRTAEYRDAGNGGVSSTSARLGVQSISAEIPAFQARPNDERREERK